MQVVQTLSSNVVPIILALVTGGGLVAYIKYLQTRPEALAKARSINISSGGELIEHYKEYIQDLEKRLGRVEKRYDDLKEEIEKKDVETYKLLTEKDREIAQLKRRVGDLEEELKLYKKI